ncbi:tetratricopeptide repeat protein [Selenomonas ruminantium]|uniref:TPR repeat n=1 Tax=Selenomonas ruminantium TaxID=971 RepID=A0A1H0U3Z8_SELRU|nr:tetratricopeptide repeat protein [Selenomonas ruminantium]SDP60566.1 hypothetical protein SAMN05216366_12819 [Selenomonas ruminantium]
MMKSKKPLIAASLMACFLVLTGTASASSTEVFADVGKMATAEQVFSKLHLPAIHPKMSRQDKAARKARKEEKKKQAQLLQAYRKYDFQQVQAWAEQNDPEAMFIVAYACRTGQQVPRDAGQAASWQQKAARANGELAKVYASPAYTKKTLPLCRLYAMAGRRAHTGDVVRQSYDKAVRWSQLGAREGDPAAIAYIGSAYYTGRGLPKDEKRAITYFERAPHDPLSVRLLADAYKNGHGVKRNQEKGEEYETFLRIAQDKMNSRYKKGVPSWVSDYR